MLKAIRFPFIITGYAEDQRDVIFEAVKETFNGPKQARMLSRGSAIGFYTMGQSLDQLQSLAAQGRFDFDLTMIGYEESDLLLCEDGDPFPARTLIEIVGYTAHVKDGEFINGTEKIDLPELEEDIQNYILQVLD